jgi:signal transduction histidine kinase
MTLRQRALVALLVLLAIGLGSVGVTAWARALRNETLELFVALDHRSQLLGAVDQCLHDHHRQMTLLLQTAGGGAAPLDAEVRGSLRASMAACTDELRRLGDAPAPGAVPATPDPLPADGQRLLETWATIAETLGSKPVEAITLQATVADPLAEGLLTVAVPEARRTAAAQLQAARGSFRVASARADTLIAVGLFAPIVVLVAATGLLLRRVLHGLDVLAAATERYAVGDFGHRVSLPGQDELAVVAGRVNDMAGSLETAHDELQRRARDLQATVDTLRSAQATIIRQEKMAALGDLVAGVAHEVNTPLGVAVTSTSLLLEHVESLHGHAEAGTATKGMLRRMADDIRVTASLLTDNLKRAAKLVQSFKQVAVDRESIDTRTSRLSEWGTALIQSLSPLTRRHRVQVTLTVEPDAEVIVAAGELEQVVTNLIVNACVHGYPDAVEPGTVHVTLALGPDALEIVVADTGRGMAPEVAARVFEPFFTTRRGSGGTGLGMHIVHQIIAERFQGEIALDTAPGAGARWSLRLPHPTDALQLTSQGPHDHTA